MQSWRMHVLIISLTCLVLSACAGKKIVNTAAIQQQAMLEASNAITTPEQAIEIAQQKYADAINAELNTYAPLHLKQAQENITLAHESLKITPKDPKGKALTAAIAAQNFIADGFKIKNTVQENLKRVLTHNAELIKLKAPTQLATEYQIVHTHLLDLIRLIEAGQVVDAILGQPSLLAEMSKLEIGTLKQTYLSEAVNLIKKTKDIDGEKYAQASFKKAVELIKTANTFITKNYRNRKAVKKVGEEALWGANHTYFVALESKKIMQLESIESEQYILSQIAHQNSVSQIVSANDLAPQSISTANTELLKIVSDLKAQLKLSQQALNNALSTNNTTPLFNTEIAPDEDEATFLRTFPSTSKQEEGIFSEKQTAVNEPSFQADEQSFDDIERMPNEG
ncbi:MAG: hypothetical protein ACI84K_001570 [Pseudohongiellaceae bacterium]|jgi:hypothetical protein